jgi:hypothetical protein
MPKQQSRQKTLHYKRAEIVGGELRPLEDLLNAALATRPRPLLRAERLGASNENVRLINRCRRISGMTIGIFLDFTEGNHQPTILLVDQIELAISQLPPRKREQFIEGMLYFGIQDNHVVLLQSRGLRAGHFENHLNWLLSELTTEISDGSRILLMDEPHPDARERFHGVKSVTLFAPVDVNGLRKRPRHTPISLREKIIDALSIIVDHPESLLSSLSAEEALEMKNLEISLRVRQTGRGPKSDESVLDDLAFVLRDSEAGDIEIATGSGAVIRGSELRLSSVRSIATTNGIPVLASVAENMNEWLRELVQQRQVRS